MSDTIHTGLENAYEIRVYKEHVFIAHSFTRWSACPCVNIAITCLYCTVEYTSNIIIHNMCYKQRSNNKNKK